MKHLNLNKLSKLFALLILISACGNPSGSGLADSSKQSPPKKGSKTCNSTYSKAAVDSLIKAGIISPDSLPDLPPTQAEERERIRSGYNNVKIIDSVWVNNGDTLHLYAKYHCLKNVSLVVPKHYDWDEKNPQDFATHPFVADVLLTNNTDTLLNKQFKAADFNPFFEDNFGGGLKKYGTIIDLYVSKQHKTKNQITLFFSIAIPATDLGIGLSLLINNKGEYKIKDE